MFVDSLFRDRPGRLAVRLGQEVDDQCLRDLLRFGRELAQRQKHQEKRRIDGECQRKAGRSALERRALIGCVKSVGAQGSNLCRVGTSITESDLNRE